MPVAPRLRFCARRSRGHRPQPGVRSGRARPQRPAPRDARARRARGGRKGRGRAVRRGVRRAPRADHEPRRDRAWSSTGRCARSIWRAARPRRPRSLKPSAPAAGAGSARAASRSSPRGACRARTEFTVEVPAGTRALDGARSPSRTPSPSAPAAQRSRASSPGRARTTSSRTRRFELRFNQPVDDRGGRAARVTSPRAIEKHKVAFEVRRPDPKNEMLVELVPRAPLPRDSAIEIAVAEGLRGREGPLPAGEEQRFAFRTYGPLRVEAPRVRSRTRRRSAARPTAGSRSPLEPRQVRGREAGDLGGARRQDAAGRRGSTDDEPTSHVPLGGASPRVARYRVRVAAGLKRRARAGAGRRRHRGSRLRRSLARGADRPRRERASSRPSAARSRSCR